MVKVKVSRSRRGSGGKSPTVSWAQLMKGRAHPSPFAALAFPNSKKVPIYCWVDRESFPVVAWRSPASNSRPYGDFLHRNRAALTTGPRHLLKPTCILCQLFRIQCQYSWIKCNSKYQVITPSSVSYRVGFKS